MKRIYVNDVKNTIRRDRSNRGELFGWNLANHTYRSWVDQTKLTNMVHYLQIFCAITSMHCPMAYMVATISVWYANH